VDGEREGERMGGMDKWWGEGGERERDRQTARQTDRDNLKETLIICKHLLKYF